MLWLLRDDAFSVITKFCLHLSSYWGTCITKDLGLPIFSFSLPSIFLLPSHTVLLTLPSHDIPTTFLRHPRDVPTTSPRRSHDVPTTFLRRSYDVPCHYHILNGQFLTKLSVSNPRQLWKQFWIVNYELHLHQYTHRLPSSKLPSYYPLAIPLLSPYLPLPWK